MQCSPTPCTFSSLIVTCHGLYQSCRSLQHTLHESMHIPIPNPQSSNTNVSLTLSSRFSDLTVTYETLYPDRYGLSESIFSLLDQILSLETCLGSLYSRTKSQGWIPLLKHAILATNFLIQLHPHPTSIVLALITAMAYQALEPFDARLSYFEYTDAENPGPNRAAISTCAPTAATVRRDSCGR